MRLRPAERYCGSWLVEHRTGTAGELLGLDEPTGGCRVARLHSVVRAALVLGSAQSFEIVDRSRAVAAGADIVHRRSGGGAVLLTPAGQVWIDFFVPVGDRLWREDIAQAALWVGELWAEVASSLTASGPVVHSGGLVADCWGRMVCFAGVGPGEVLINDRKVVGVSQRRNRSRIRIQTAARVSGAALRSPGIARSSPGVALRGPGIARSSPGAALRNSGTDGGDAESQGWQHRPQGFDEMGLLALTSKERAEGRSVLSERCGVLAADSDTVVGALFERLESY